MIEYPEAVIISRQMAAELAGRRIAEAQANASPHKFAFFTGDPSAYPSLLVRQALGTARANGSLILVPVGRELHLVLGGGGERILLHEPGARLPAKHQLGLTCDDGRRPSVSVQGWGFVALMDHETLAAHPYAGRTRPDPLSAAFSTHHFREQFASLSEGDTRSLKAFLVSDPGVSGIGNGVLQDILFRALQHPRVRAAQLSLEQQDALYNALRATLSQMLAQGGRDSERNLCGQPGGYRRLMHSGTAGQPCRQCGTPIEKQSFLGGSVYYCPVCQPEPPRKSR